MDANTTTHPYDLRMTISSILRNSIVATTLAATAITLSPLISPAVAADRFTVYAFDEFDGAANSPPNPAIWRYETGGNWGNNEKQVYTDSRANSRLDGQGNLLIQTQKVGSTITSARLGTFGKVNFTYGLVEARIKLPAGQGLHPAFWTLGTNLYSAGWPGCGEIDAIETINDAKTYTSAVHGPTKSGTKVTGVWDRSVGGARPDTDFTAFHTYGILKRPGRIETYIDGVRMMALDKSQLSGAEAWVFDAPAYTLLNIAVGGDWPGATNSTTPWPSTMTVDYVRWFHEN